MTFVAVDTLSSVVTTLVYRPESLMTTSGRMRVGLALLGRAYWVHGRLVRAQAMGLTQSEETITESLLFDLAEELSGQVAIRVFSKWDEGRSTGADWEWWFADGLGRPMYGMRVQAKKLKQTRSGRRQYDLAYRKDSMSPLQVDLLLAAAAAASLPAVYTLYNGGELDLDDFPWRCCSLAAAEDVIGVSLLSADAAKALADSGRTMLHDVGKFMLPWSCMALCPLWLGTPKDRRSWPNASSPEATLIECVADLMTGLFVSGSSVSGLSEFDAVQQAALGFREWDAAPQYARAIATTGFDDLIQEDEDFLPTSLAGVVVFVAQRG
jgi:hypothetical protein